MKRTISVALAGLTAAAVMAGCSSGAAAEPIDIVALGEYAKSTYSEDLPLVSVSLEDGILMLVQEMPNAARMLEQFGTEFTDILMGYYTANGELFRYSVTEWEGMEYTFIDGDTGEAVYRIRNGIGEEVAPGAQE